MKAINRQLQANAGSNIHAVGTYIWLKSATGSVQIKTDKGETAVLSAGDFVRTDKPFSEFFVTDLSGAQNDLTFNTSQNGEAGLYTSNVGIASPGTYSDIADVTIILATTGLILAANSNRKEAIITALSTNGADARIGSLNAGAARGSLLVPGATLILETKAAIYGYSAAAHTYSISWTED